MYRHLPSAQGALLTNARQLSDRVICLPIYPALSDSQTQYIVELLSSPTKKFTVQVSPIEFDDVTPGGITSFDSFDNIEVIQGKTTIDINGYKITGIKNCIEKE
jgi:hypothetical protein